MNHEILIETEVDGAEPYAALLRRVIPAVLDAERVPFACEEIGRASCRERV